MTLFTLFTRFTRFTPDFTLFTPFTRFTFPTRFTPFTIDPFTRFTLEPFTPFTIDPFTRFTFEPFTRPGGEPFVTPFVRFGNRVFAPEELELARFDAFGEVAEAFAAAGVGRLDQLAALEVDTLAAVVQAPPEQVAPLVAAAQDHLRALAAGS